MGMTKNKIMTKATLFGSLNSRPDKRKSILGKPTARPIALATTMKASIVLIPGDGTTSLLGVNRVDTVESGAIDF